MSRSEFDFTVKAFPPAKVIFTGIGALLAVRALGFFYIKTEIKLIGRARRESKSRCYR